MNRSFFALNQLNGDPLTAVLTASSKQFSKPRPFWLLYRTLFDKIRPHDLVILQDMYREPMLEKQYHLMDQKIVFVLVSLDTLL